MQKGHLEIISHSSAGREWAGLYTNPNTAFLFYFKVEEEHRVLYYSLGRQLSNLWSTYILAFLDSTMKRRQEIILG